MSSTVIEVVRNVTVTDRDIDDIMSCALDGGICYWCKEANVVGEYLGEYASDQISRGGKLELVPYDDDAQVIDMEDILRGIKICLEDVFLNYDLIEEKDGKLLLNCLNVDGSVADAIVQCAAFGSNVYG